jgi:HlyD family secretion protein
MIGNFTPVSHSMDSSQPNSAAHARQTRQRFVSPEDYLSYELGKAVRELPPLYTRLMAGSLSLLIFGALGWAYFSKIDEVAVTSGELIPAQQIRPVKALNGGVIREIRVKEGQEVKQGDVLIVQDPADTQATINRLQRSAQLIRQDVARLQAERTGQTNAGTVIQDQLLASRLQDFDTKQAAALAEANRQQAVIGEAQAQLRRLQASLGNARKTLENAQERESSLRPLVADGVVPRFDYLDAKDRLTQAQDQVGSLPQQIAAQQQTIQQGEQAYRAAQQTAAGLTSQRQSEILTQLNQRQEDLTNLEGQIAQANTQQDKETIRSPINGRIYDIKATSAEGTIEPGEELLSILPNGQNLTLQVKVLNRDIGFIRTGMRAKVKLATFPFQEFGTIEGTVTQISPNATVDKDLGLIYLARVELKRTIVLVHGQQVPLAPGMAATAELVTRQKSVLTFFIEPVTRRFDEAFSVR